MVFSSPTGSHSTNIDEVSEEINQPWMAQIASKSTTNSFSLNGSSSTPGPSFSGASSSMASEGSPSTDASHISKRTGSVPASVADIPVEPVVSKSFEKFMSKKIPTYTLLIVEPTNDSDEQSDSEPSVSGYEECVKDVDISQEFPYKVHITNIDPETLLITNEYDSDDKP
ncbi:hypothetical protein L1987_19054 [Smallanthus sonchifolius]|uniref:Uncharacterized protein n=1 Tax=Smallanthus sonchifolius TaxID=185202 RepID=A0ACB9J2Y8_9ASTR|nr:hypothetical protein L1987_19054 [Smallanthus sonchifolius]